MKFSMRCPWCGHASMHHGEEKVMCGEKRTDLFSCRACGSAYDEEEIRELAQQYQAALLAVTLVGRVAQ